MFQVFIECVGSFILMIVIGYMITLAFGGKHGLKALREKAERTGDIKAVENQTRWIIFLQLAVTILVCALMITGIMWFLAKNGKQGVGMDWHRQHGPTLMLVIIAVIIFLLLLVPLIVRRKLKRYESSLTDSSRVYQIRCMNNPKRFNNCMMGLMAQFFILFFIVAIFWSPYVSNGIGVLASIIHIAITAALIRAVVSDSRNLPLLAEMDRSGIRYFTTCSKGILVEWNAVETVRVFEKQITLLMKDGGPEKEESTVVIDLGKCHYSDSSLQYMIQSVAPEGLCRNQAEM